MTMNDAIEIIKPDRDSQFLLLPCECGCDDAAYVKYKAGDNELWRVQCFTCGAVVDPGTDIRHAVQVLWNDKMRAAAGKGAKICTNTPV